MLRKIDDKWALVSKKTLRPLAYYDGDGKPTSEWVGSQERRIQAFKHGLNESLAEAAYDGNIGVMELVKFHRNANDQQKKAIADHIKNKRTKEAWDLVRSVTGVKLHKSVEEEVKKDILPKAGAGQWGTDGLTNTYIKDTPGQKRKYLRFKEYTDK